MKKECHLEVRKYTDTTVVISGFYNNEIDEICSTEYKEALDIILSSIDNETADLIRRSHIKSMSFDCGRIVIKIEEPIECC